MPNVIAFFPWVAVQEPMHVGPIRLLPYHRRKLPGALPEMTQDDIDGVFAAYSSKPASRQKKQATILEVDDWRTGMEANPDTVARFFKARHAIAFSALARRRLFTDVDYCNFHTYTLIAQRFAPGQTDTFAFLTRRRDGGTNQIWGSDEYAFHLPLHVSGNADLRVDAGLVETLMNLPSSHSHIFQAIEEFNAANTDSSDVPEHVEVVMMKSAFEWLLRIREDAQSFQKSVAATLSDLPGAPRSTGPMEQPWAQRWNKARPIEAWTRDFCAVRAGSAHGLRRGREGSSVWSATSHLAFGAFLFPLLVKKVMHDSGLITLDDRDRGQLQNIDAYLMHDPFAKRDRREQHPWSRAERAAHRLAHHDQLHAELSRVLESGK